MQTIAVIMECMESLRGALMRNVITKSPLAEDGCKVTPSQMELLQVLAKQDGCSIKRLAEALRVTSSAATQTVDALEEKSLVTRAQDPEDGRSTLVRMNPEFGKHLRKMHQDIAATFNAVFATLNDDELETYAALSRKIAAAARIEPRP